MFFLEKTFYSYNCICVWGLYTYDIWHCNVKAKVNASIQTFLHLKALETVRSLTEYVHALVIHVYVTGNLWNQEIRVFPVTFSEYMYFLIHLGNTCISWKS